MPGDKDHIYHPATAKGYIKNQTTARVYNTPEQ